ncbi:MAG: TRAP transporter substrate-binding protein [Betaproteobacteria bacterium]|nr:TRAP transporter substrate-binding protein [Betaproteobacteria bacterium]MBI2959554.1 TRAP transporter substrate-binding protein [Betaproteobacteria bacterium]
MNRITQSAVVVASLLAAGAALGQTKAAAPAGNVLIGTATANDTQAAAAEKFAELLTKYSNGRFKGAARTGGSLGSNMQMLAGLQAGAVHGMVTPAGILAPAVPEISLFDMPFLLPSTPAQMTAFAAQSKAAARIMASAEQKGIHIIGFHGIGPSSFLTRFPVKTLADVQGKKFGATIPSPLRISAYQAWRWVTRPIGFDEVYSNLQQGIVDAMEGPPDVIYRMKLYEVAKYYTVTGHFSLLANIIVSKKWFDGLPKDLQDAVTRAGKETMVFADAAFTKSQNEGLEGLKKVVTVTQMPPAEIQRMKDLAKGVREQMKKDPQRGPIVELLEEDAARFSKK